MAISVAGGLSTVVLLGDQGAFTGASQQRAGRFELASGGTLFLDEIEELPLLLQAKLLRVLQEMKFERLGGTRTLDADIRLIAATNRHLEEEVKAKAFREDLCYRLNVFPIQSIPSCKDR
jgi:transcriptional regulator with GAF, ATPase, and Fis domain